MNIAISVYLFLLGAACGSFALVLATRMHAGRDWVKGRSSCDHCGHALSPSDLVPLVSWLKQRGHCRYCGIALELSYPLTEASVGVSFVASFWLFPYEFSSFGIVLFCLWLVALVIMTALIIQDLKWFRLYTKLVYPLAAIGFMHWLIAVTAYGQLDVESVLNLAASIMVSAGLFWALHRVSKGKWIGDGDYRLGVAIGFFLGSPALSWIGLFCASIFGLLFAVPVLVKSRGKTASRIPFGPFLILGLVVSYFFGQQIVDWYTGTFLYL